MKQFIARQQKLTKGERMERFIYEVAIGQDESGWYAYVPDLPGCFGQGDTYDDVIESINNGLESHVEGLVAFGMDVPASTFGHEPEKEGERMAVFSFYADPEPVDGYVTAAEAARILGVTKPRVSHMIRDGVLDALRKGRSTYITTNSLERRIGHPVEPTIHP